MKKRIYFGLLSVCMTAAFVFQGPPDGTAGVNVNVGVSLPFPAVTISSPPSLVVIPGTYAYFAPDVNADLIFYHNYWYRPYEGRWYRASGYNGPWGFIGVNRVPGVLLHLPPGYRHVPPGFQRIPYGQLKNNWRAWERERHWDRHEMHREAKELRRAEKEHWKEEKREAKRERKGHWED